MSHTLCSGEHCINNQHRIEIVVEQFRRLKGKLNIRCSAFARHLHPALASALRFADLGSSWIWPTCDHPEMLFHQTQYHPGLEVADQNKNRVVRDEVQPGVPLHIITADQLDVGQPAEGRPTIRMALERSGRDLVVQQVSSSYPHVHEPLQ